MLNQNDILKVAQEIKKEKELNTYKITCVLEDNGQTNVIRERCEHLMRRKRTLFLKFLPMQQRRRLVLILKFPHFYCSVAFAKSCKRVKFHNWQLFGWKTSFGKVVL